MRGALRPTVNGVSQLVGGAVAHSRFNDRKLPPGQTCDGTSRTATRGGMPPLLTLSAHIALGCPSVLVWFAPERTHAGSAHVLTRRVEAPRHSQCCCHTHAVLD